MSSLKNRTRFSNTLENELFAAFNELSKETMIPKSKLLDEAIKLLLKKFDKNNKEDKQ